MINSTEIHIWLASLIENEKNISFYRSVLSPGELVKANSCKFSKDQRYYALSRGILRCLLAKYVKQNPQDIEILYGAWGKPYLSQGLHLYFNVSHSKDYVIYALSSRYEVGIDLEFIDPHLDFDSMVSSILSSPQELDYWRTVKEEEKKSSFFKLWVCKEAFLKASGKGWLQTENHLPSQTINNLKLEYKGSPPNQNMNLSPYIFEAVPGYIAALFLEGSNGAVPLHYSWNSSSILLIK